ncbi:TPA: bacterial Ig-like domain-containing protein, partial [Enterococcus faecalis]|nr:bacterial Ig-like domain-containing protein [Enterococcus faecalis]HBI1887158.1 bacterial Ig-like domain-containing protein [Enterococcus faecalis]
IPQYCNNEYLNQHIKDYIDLKGYSTIEVKKFSSFPETDKVGKTSGKIVVEETLKSGKKVQWEYEVLLTVIENKMSIKTKDITLNKGDAYTWKDSFVSATDEDGKNVSVDDDRIISYGAGAVNTKIPGEYEIIFELKGTHKNVRSTAKIIVENKWVNVTIPTKMLFFSDMKSGTKGKVISENHLITNNSDNTSLEVEMASFSVAKDSEVTYLSPSEENPTKPENKLRLNLLVNGQPKVQGLTNETKTTHLVDVDVKKSINLTFEGQYFNANSEDSREAKSSMVLKFNIKK